MQRGSSASLIPGESTGVLMFLHGFAELQEVEKAGRPCRAVELIGFDFEPCSAEPALFNMLQRRSRL